MSLAWARAALSRLPLLRSLVTLAFGAALYYVRIVRFSHGYRLQDFANEAHNPLALIRSAPRRLLAKAFVQSWAVAGMALPVFLSHEHQASAPVTTLADARNALTLLVWGGGCCLARGRCGGGGMAP